MDDRTIIVLWICTLIAMLESFALYLGIDGQLFGVAIAAIAGIAGFEIKHVWEYINSNSYSHADD